jgi:phosphate transport system substrate-binding protein
LSKALHMFGIKTTALLTILCLVTACGPPGTDKLDTITSGEIYIVADESLEGLISTGVYNFEAINPDAKINVLYHPEAVAYQMLRSDSIRLLIGGRQLYEGEHAFLNEVKIRPRVTPLAYDAVALVSSAEGNELLLEYDELHKILKGEISDWQELRQGGRNGEIIIVFDNSGSGAMTALLTTYELDSLGCKAYALKSNEAVIEYIHDNPRSIGIIGNCWISSLNRAETFEFESKVKMVAISNPQSDYKGYFLPEQTFIADSSYPIIRTIYSISRESRVGLGTGFASFMASERGQRIVLKSGLLPYVMPSRELIIYGND